MSQSYMWRHIDVQADWRSSGTYGRTPNAIDISYGSLTCPSKHRQGTTLFIRWFRHTAQISCWHILDLNPWALTGAICTDPSHVNDKIIVIDEEYVFIDLKYWRNLLTFEIQIKEMIINFNVRRPLLSYTGSIMYS